MVFRILIDINHDSDQLVLIPGPLVDPNAPDQGWLGSKGAELCDEFFVGLE